MQLYPSEYKVIGRAVLESCPSEAGSLVVQSDQELSGGCQEGDQSRQQVGRGAVPTIYTTTAGVQVIQD